MNNNKSATVMSIAIFGIIFALLLGVTVKKTNESYVLTNKLNDVYSRAILQVVDSIDDVDTALMKGSVTNSPFLLNNISNEIYRFSTFAKANLGELPLGNAQFDKTSKFLSQVGDFTFALSNKVLKGEKITDEEKRQMANLSKYATTLSNSLIEIEEKMMNGKITFIDREKTVSAANDDATPLSDGINNIEKNFQEYPSLIYDGPFSDHINKLEAKHIKGAKEISKDDAKNKVYSFISDTKIEKLVHKGEGKGTIETHIFSGADENNTDFSIEISKLGGNVLYMLKNRNVKSGNLTINDAIKIGSDFLVKNNIDLMKESYYEVKNNVATINYAYTQNGIVMYPDLIKIKIALDNGEVLGFESQGYIMAHEETRILNPINISLESARNLISKNINIQKESMAVIPLEGGKEVLCYEFLGTFNDKTFIVYINASTGIEEKILMLLTDETKTLTI